MTELTEDIKSTNLTIKQALFIEEYLVDHNATQACIRAGYSVDSARAIACEMLTKPYIRDLIQKAMDMRVQRTQITCDRVLTEIAKMGFADVRNLFDERGKLKDVKELDDNTAAAIQSIEVVVRKSESDENEYLHKIKLVDKKSALELLGKHMKLFTDRTEITGKDGGAIEIKVDMQDTEASKLYRELLSRQ